MTVTREATFRHGTGQSMQEPYVMGWWQRWLVANYGMVTLHSTHHTLDKTVLDNMRTWACKYTHISML